MGAKGMEKAKAMVESSKIAAKGASAFMHVVAKSQKKAAGKATVVLVRGSGAAGSAANVSWSCCVSPRSIA